jgi:hypothetical protein
MWEANPLSAGFKAIAVTSMFCKCIVLFSDHGTIQLHIKDETRLRLEKIGICTLYFHLHIEQIYQMMMIRVDLAVIGYDLGGQP